MNGWLPKDDTPPFFGVDRTRKPAAPPFDAAAWEGDVVGERIGAWVERVTARAVTAVSRVVGVRAVRWLRRAL